MDLKEIYVSEKEDIIYDKEDYKEYLLKLGDRFDSEIDYLLSLVNNDDEFQRINLTEVYNKKKISLEALDLEVSKGNGPIITVGRAFELYGVELILDKKAIAYPLTDSFELLIKFNVDKYNADNKKKSLVSVDFIDIIDTDLYGYED